MTTRTTSQGLAEQPRHKPSQHSAHPAGHARVRGRLDRWPQAALIAAAGACYAVGIAIVIGVYHHAQRTSSTTYYAVFWVGIVLVFGSIAVLWFRYGTRRLGYLFAALLGASTYLPKYLMSVHYPRYYDEWGHVKHFNVLLTTNDVFSSDSFIPIVKYFPGLSLATALVHYTTGLSGWPACNLTALLAHCLTLVAIYRLALRVGISHRRAAACALIYAIGPNYMYFDAQYAYETLGIGLALITAELAIAIVDASKRSLTLDRVIAFGLAAAWTVLTHHVSALFCTVFLLSLALATAVTRQPGRAKLAAAGAAAWMTAIAVVWIGFVAPTAGYILPKVSIGARQLLEIVGLGSSKDDTSANTGNGDGGTRARSVLSTTSTPGYERIFAFAGFLIVLVVVVWSVWNLLWRDRRAQSSRTIAVLVPFTLLALVFFASLPVVFSPTGAEIAHRSWAFTWIGVAVLAAAAPIPRFRAVVPPVVAVAVAAALFVITFIGMTTSGTNANYRFPGPYKFGNDSRSINADEIAVAHWFTAHGVSSGGVVTDRFTGSVLTGYTNLDVPGSHHLNLYHVYMYPTDMPPGLITTLRTENVHYFVFDTYALTRLPSDVEFYPGYATYSRINLRGLTRLVRGDTTYWRPLTTIGHYVIYQLR